MSKSDRRVCSYVSFLGRKMRRIVIIRFLKASNLTCKRRITAIINESVVSEEKYFYIQGLPAPAMNKQIGTSLS